MKKSEEGLGFAKQYIWEQDSQNLGCFPRAEGVWEGMPEDFGILFLCRAVYLIKTTKNDKMLSWNTKILLNIRLKH
jgi:hypothetical protein